VLGIYPRVSAIALLLFLISATLMAHAFWQAAATGRGLNLRIGSCPRKVCL